MKEWSKKKIRIMAVAILVVLCGGILWISFGLKKEEEKPWIEEVAEETKEVENSSEEAIKKPNKNDGEKIEEMLEESAKPETEVSMEVTDSESDEQREETKKSENRKKQPEVESSGEERKESESSGEEIRETETTEENSSEPESLETQPESSEEETRHPSTEEASTEETSTEEETKESQPEVHIHVWGAWTSKGDKEERECVHCGMKETKSHNYIVIKEVYIYNVDDTHIINKTYECSCGNSYQETETQECQYGEWLYVELATEERICKHCKHSEARVHEHEEPDPQMEYVCKISNGNGTHKMEMVYTCSICSELVTKQKDEECDYVVSFERTGVNDIHIEKKDCKVCGDHKQKEGACVPTGDMQLVKIYAQIYEYYDCELCGDMCQRKYHTNHIFDDCEYRDDRTHISYCICIEERKTESHDFEYPVDENDDPIPSDVLTCKDCHTSKDIAWHDHKKGAKDNMGLMEIVMNKPLYNEILDTKQISNPYPSPDEYCSLYELRCQECGQVYTIEYDHDFGANGICTRTGYCGGISRN